jgi:putative phosphoesterase
MIKILIIGDAHIPRRAQQVPPPIIDKLKQLSSKEPFDYSFFTGDEVHAPEFMNFLNLITKRDLFRVVGNMDYYENNRDLPMHREKSILLPNNQKIIIGLTHGAQINPRGDHDQLELLAQEKNYHVLITGHTHKEETFLSPQGILILNPGSVTGAWSFVASGVPSFMDLLIDEGTCRLKITLFQLDSHTNKISERIYRFKFEKNKITSKL